MAIVVSLAALAGCGEAAGVPLAGTDLPSGGPGGLSEVSSGPAEAASREQDGNHDATDEDGRRSASDAHSEQRAAARSDGPAGDERRPRDRTSPPPTATPEPAERSPHAPAGGPASAAPQSGGGADTTDIALDEYEGRALALLAAARDELGLVALRVDADLVRGARERACTMASGATPLLAEDDTENIGLVVEVEPDPAATAMHDWWMRSAETRSIRLAPGVTRYGVGACPADDRVYYSERFGS